MDSIVTLGISLGLGLLIGLQRERTESRLGGIRTFPLVSMFGTFCGMVTDAQIKGGDYESQMWETVTSIAVGAILGLAAGFLLDLQHQSDLNSCKDPDDERRA